jgi:hypothetical protein
VSLGVQPAVIRTVAISATLGIQLGRFSLPTA